MSVTLRRRAERRPEAGDGVAPPIAMTAAAGAEAEAAVEAGPYVGLVTRTIAFALDAALVNVVAIAITGTVTLAASVINVPHEVRVIAASIGAGLYVLWVVGYFATFWTTTGQTPGDRLLRIRVVPASGGRMRPRRALLRFVALTLAALPLFAGFLIILVDDRRRGLHDRIARTVVVEAPPESEVPAARHPPPAPVA